MNHVNHLTELLIERIVQRRAEIERILCEISDARAVTYEIDSALATLRGAPGEIERHRPTRVESLCVFLPSNVLLYSWVLYVAVPLLYSERIHLRAARSVQSQVTRLQDLLTEGLGLTVTLHDVSQREYVDEVARGSQVVVFTGAYQNAEEIRHRLDPGQLMLFMGSGINPFVVGPEADLAHAAEELVSIRTLNSGQDCLAPDVVWVHEDVCETLLDRLHAKLNQQAQHGVSEALAPKCGRIHYADALGSTASYLFKYRDRIVSGGSVSFAQRIIEPTVLLWDAPASKVATAEFFAPVFNLAIYRDEQQLLDTLTSGRYAETAMGASLFGCSESMHLRLQTLYTVTHNVSMLAADNGNEPLGGRGPMANYVAHRGTLSAQPILISKVVADFLGQQAHTGDDRQELAA